MSGVEAGATIVGLVGFGLTSLKTIYQFISNVKDGPEKVRDLANDLKTLQAAYERIEVLDDLPGFASSPSLTNLIKNCNESIEKLQKKIGKLQVRPNDKFHGIVWKRLKMAFNDDEIAQVLDVLSGYVNKFTLEISVIELRLMHQNAGHMSQLVAGGERHFAMARQHHTILDKVGKDVGEFFPQIQQVQNGVDAVAVKITSMQSLSVRQSVGIAERLEKLETEVARMSLRNKAPVNDYGIHDNMWAVPLEETQNSTILESIRSLCGLVDRQERHIESDEAQDIIEDLETLLHDLDSSKSNIKRAFTSTVTMESLATERELSRDIRRFRGIVSSSTDVTLNHFSASKPTPSTTPWSQPILNSDLDQHSSAEPVGKVNKSIQTWTQHKSQQGHWIISTRKRWRRNTFEDGDKTIQDSIASVLFKPNGSHSHFMIKATVQQFQRIHGFYSLAPALTVSRIRPRSSRVFHCVRFGDMAGLLQLLASGEASLQDRDDQGATLLHYSFEQPRMSQFLVGHGADPDDIAQCDHLLNEMPWWVGEEFIAFNYSPIRSRTPLALSFESLDKGSFKELLDAGADPAVRIQLTSKGQLFTFELYSYLIQLDENDPFDVMFRMGGHFIDVSRPVQTRIDTYTSQSLLLHECCTNSDIAKMRTLIDHGANIDARDQNGYISLHYLVTKIRRVHNSSERDFESLIYLIKSGADIHSRDNAGQSIWDAAMNNRRKGSYARDMWDFALVYCGYISDMEAFTRDNPRHAVYWEGRYDEYLRADFEEIWEGWEHLCPYYGDEESGLDCASFILGTPPQTIQSSTSCSTSTTSSMWVIDERDIDQTPPNQQQDSSEDELPIELPDETIDRLTQESDREEHSRVDNSCYEELRLTEDRVASLGTSHLDESVKTWLSKSSVSSDMSDSSSVASLQDLHNTEVGFSKEVYENPWAEG